MTSRDPSSTLPPMGDTGKTTQDHRWWATLAEAEQHLVVKAYQLASIAHAGQVDKSGVDYIEHPIAVAEAVRHHGTAYEVVAVLHDTVEDTVVTLDQIEEMFGPRVREAVDSVSRREGEAYADFVLRAGANEIGRVVKKADIEHNLSRPAGLTPSLEKRYEAALLILELEPA